MKKILVFVLFVSGMIQAQFSIMPFGPGSTAGINDSSFYFHTDRTIPEFRLTTITKNDGSKAGSFRMSFRSNADDIVSYYSMTNNYGHSLMQNNEGEFLGYVNQVYQNINQLAIGNTATGKGLLYQHDSGTGSDVLSLSADSVLIAGHITLAGNITYATQVEPHRINPIHIAGDTVQVDTVKKIVIGDIVTDTNSTAIVVDGTNRKVEINAQDFTVGGLWVFHNAEVYSGIHFESKWEDGTIAPSAVLNFNIEEGFHLTAPSVSINALRSYFLIEDSSYQHVSYRGETQGAITYQDKDSITQTLYNEDGTINGRLTIKNGSLGDGAVFTLSSILDGVEAKLFFSVENGFLFQSDSFIFSGPHLTFPNLPVGSAEVSSKYIYVDENGFLKRKP